MIYAKERGMAIAALPLLWAGMSVAKMLIAIPAGLGADRYGRMPMLALAWSLRVVVLALLARTDTSQAAGMALVLAYGASLALAEPAERSLIADVAPSAHRGTLYGAYYLLSGLAVLPGALVFGGLWSAYGSSLAFQAGAVLTAVAAVAMGIARLMVRANPT
jgi:MFS family permease